MTPTWVVCMYIMGVILAWSFGALWYHANTADHEMEESISNARIWCNGCSATIWKADGHIGPSDWDEYGYYTPYYCDECWEVVLFKEAVR